MQISVNTRFGIGDKVYHVTPDSPQGIILEVRAYPDKVIEYFVAFGLSDRDWYYQEEITDSKTF